MMNVFSKCFDGQFKIFQSLSADFCEKVDDRKKFEVDKTSKKYHEIQISKMFRNYLASPSCSLMYLVRV